MTVEEELIQAQEKQIALLKEESQLLRQLADQQHQELARHRQREHLIDNDEWGFVRWLLLRDVWPFSWWYHRFER
jgi:hypothetical protein